MGSGMDLLCPKCGYGKNISYGGGFMSGPRNMMVREQIMEGKFGARPKEILEGNPDADFYWYMALFHCSCGNISTKSTVQIWEDGKPIYKPSMRCGFCHKKMWEIQEPPYFIPCPKCGTRMESVDFVNWD